MTEINKDDQKRERIGNYYPPILNCGGGIDGDHLLGVLTYEEIQEVKSMPVAREIKDQQVGVNKYPCGERGEVEIAYYPQIASRFGSNKTIGALCFNTDCKYNSSEPAKKS